MIDSISREYVALDIETTGLNPDKDSIIEIGAVRYQNGKPIETFSSLIKPPVRVSSRITEITGISNEMLMNERECCEVLKEFLAFIKDDVIMGHNVQFDYSFLKVQATRQGFDFTKKAIDTLYLAKKLHQDLTSRSLGAMCAYYGIVNEHAHRAYDDAKACARIYEMMVERFANDMPEIFAPKLITYKVKKVEGITNRQKMYLNDLVKYHKINLEMPIDELTKSDASRLIDKIILKHGRIPNLFSR